MSNYTMICDRWIPRPPPPVGEQLRNPSGYYRLWDTQSCTFRNAEGETWHQEDWAPQGEGPQLARDYRCTEHNRRPRVLQRYNAINDALKAQALLAYNLVYAINIHHHNADAITRARINYPNHVEYPADLTDRFEIGRMVWIPRRPAVDDLHIRWQRAS